MAHKVLLAIPNPFVKTYPFQGSKPCFVWLTREDQYRDGRDSNRVIGSHYLLMVYDFKGRVKWHWEWEVLHRMHRPTAEKDKTDFRGTGRSRQELQAELDLTIEHFKELHPGKEVPSSLVNWVDNIATDEDVAEARRRQEARNPQ